MTDDTNDTCAVAELSAQDFINPHTNDELPRALIAERAEVEPGVIRRAHLPPA
jgi:hypothetical protein